MSPARILRTLDFGPMMSVAYPLKRPEREALAAFLGKGADEPALPPSAMCGPERRILAGNDGTGWSGWSPAPDNARFQPRQRAGLSAADLPRLELKWAFGFPGDVTAFAAPTVLSGHAVRRQRRRRGAGARRADRLRALAVPGERSRTGRDDDCRRRRHAGARLQRPDRLGLFR